MTINWTTNQCAINQNVIFNNFDAKGFRKSLYVELFFLLLLYFISQILKSFFYKD